MKYKLILIALFIAIPFTSFANVTVYEHCDFRGFKATLPVGNYDLNDLKNREIYNDDISSLRVKKGYEVIVYEHDKFHGRKLQFKSDDLCLVNNNFNDRISSLKVRKISGTNVATVYQHCDFGGYRKGLPVGNYSLNDLRRRGIINDDISSLRVRQGYEVIVYEHNFSGRKLKFRSDDKCLVNNNFNDRISSIKVRKISNTKVVTVYQHCNYNGYRKGLPVGNYSLNDLKRRGIINDDISSLRVKRGYEAIVYEHNFSGRKLQLRSDNKCLVDNNFNDRISSIKVRKISKPSPRYRKYGTKF